MLSFSTANKTGVTISLLSGFISFSLRVECDEEDEDEEVEEAEEQLDEDEELLDEYEAAETRVPLFAVALKRLFSSDDDAVAAAASLLGASFAWR